MASIKKRIIFYSKKARKPVIMYPSSLVWINSFNNAYIEWKYIDSDIQTKFILEVSPFEDFSRPNMIWRLEEESSRNRVYLTENPTSGPLITQSQSYYFRIRAVGSQRLLMSDWSNTGKINIDISKPSILDIDIITLCGWEISSFSTGKYVAEIHSNMSLFSLPKNNIGYYIGNEYNENLSNKILYVVNDSNTTKTFYGQIINADSNPNPLNNIKIDVTSTGSVDNYFIRSGSIVDPTSSVEGEKNGIQFICVLEPNEKIALRYLLYNTSAIKYDLRICDFNILSNLNSGFPQNANSEQNKEFYKNSGLNNRPDQYSVSMMKTMINIGGACSPSAVLSQNNITSYGFTILEKQQNIIPVGYNNMINLDNNSHDDTSVKQIIGNSVIQSSIKARNIKSGDYLKFTRSFEAFNYNNKSDYLNGYINDQYSFTEEPQIKRGLFQISDVVYDGSTASMTVKDSQGFAPYLCNKKYTPSSDVLPGIENFECTEENISFSDGTQKSRFVTTIVADERFSSSFENLVKIGDNGLSCRWLALKTESSTDDYLFYPIFLSKDNELKIVSKNSIYIDFINNGWSLSENINFYVTGDVFIPSTSVFVEDINNTLFFIGVNDAVSGIKSIGYKINKYEIVKTRDIFGNNFEYINRTISNSDLDNLIWKNYTSESDKLIKIDVDFEDSLDGETKYVYEILMDAVDNANNYVSNGSIYKTVSACFMPLYFDTLKTDSVNISIDGQITINNKEKHSRTNRAVVDFYNTKDNDSISFSRITEFNPTALYNTGTKLVPKKNYYYYISDPNGLSMTWHKWKLGANFRVISTGTVEEPNSDISPYFVLNISRDIPPNYVDKYGELLLTDLKDFRMDIVNSIIRIPNTDISYQIIGFGSSDSGGGQERPLQFDYVFYDKLFLSGVPSSTIKEGTEFIINTGLNWPNGTFSQNGWVASYYINDGTKYGLIRTRTEETIDFFNTRSIGDNLNILQYVQENDSAPEEDNEQSLDFQPSTTSSSADKNFFISAEINGWFYSKYNSKYRIITKAKDCSLRIFVERDVRIPLNTNSDPYNQTNKGAYSILNFPKYSRITQAPAVYSAPKNELTEDFVTINMQNGWNAMNIFLLSKINKDTGASDGEFAIYYRSDVDDTIYRNQFDTSSEIAMPYIVYDTIEENENICSLKYFNGEDFIVEDNGLSGKYALVDILDARTALEPSLQDDMIGTYSEMTVSSFGEVSIEAIGASLNFYDDIYFVQRVSNYGISRLNFSGYNETETVPYNRIPTIVDPDTLNDMKILDSSPEYNKQYRIGKRRIKIINNSGNQIEFEPIQTGTWNDIVKISEDTYELEDNSQNWEIDYLVGYPVKIDINATNNLYTILTNTHNKITIKGDNVPANNIKNKRYRIGYIKDIFSDPLQRKYIYAPVGQERQLIGGDNVVRKAAKIYGIASDSFNNSRVFSKAISLKGTDTSQENEDDILSNGIIEVEISSQRVISTYGASSQVYDANETESVVGVYESNPISAPSGFSYWKTLSWEQFAPTGTSVKVYIRTAETESELLNKEYNVDAMGVLYQPFDTSSFDVPISDPNSLNISHFSSNGRKNSRGELTRNKWLQFKVILRTSVINTTPTIGNIKITYTSSKEVVMYTKNFSLKGKIRKGFLSINAEIPYGTNIIWGINTSNESDFNKYQSIPLDEAFDILEPNSQFKLAAKLISSGSDTPKIFDINFQYDTDGESDLLNENL